MSSDKKEKKKNRWYPLAWSTRGFALGANALLLMQVTYYATESVGLSAGSVGVMLLVSKILDAFTNLMAGFIVDKTKTRWGKARPYELFMIPVWVLTVLLFSTPEMGKTGQMIYFFVLFNLINGVCVTSLSASETVFLSRSTRDDGLRAKALTVSGILSMIIPAIVSIILPMLMAAWGNQPGGWTKIILVFAVPFTLLGLIRFFCIKELDMEDEVHNELSFKESLKVLAKNKFIFILAGTALLCNTAINIVAAVQTYYFTYVVGNLSLMSVIGMLGLLTPFVLILFPIALGKIGGMNFVKVGLVIACVGNVIKFFAGANMTLILIGSFLAGIGTSTLLMIGSIFVIQCMDYGEWKTGIRIEGAINSVYGFASVVGSGVASGLVGLIMGMTGYVGGAAQQTSTAMNAIIACFSIVPAALCLLMLILLQFYKLEKMEGQIRADLEERRSNK